MHGESGGGQETKEAKMTQEEESDARGGIYSHSRSDVSRKAELSHPMWERGGGSQKDRMHRGGVSASGL